MRAFPLYSGAEKADLSIAARMRVWWFIGREGLGIRESSEREEGHSAIELRLAREEVRPGGADRLGRERQQLIRL